MHFIHQFIEESKIFFEQLGALGLFLLAFIESSVFIIPPDTLLIALVLITPSAALFLAFICTIGSTLGGLFGYALGYYGGRPILEKVVGEVKLAKVNAMYEKYGVWAVALAGFSPIPYKVFTISSGLFKLNIFAFTIASFLSRGARFLLVAIVIMLFGEPIIANLKEFIIFGTALFIACLAIYFIYKGKFIKNNAPSSL